MNTILVVDDSSVTRRVIAHPLLKAGYRVITANDGAEALDIILSQVIDLVISDLDMPIINGLELLAHLRRQQTTCQIPLILLTASGSENDRYLASQSGADGFLTKPASTNDLLSLVQQFMND